MLQRLEHLRTQVHQRLDAIENLVRERTRRGSNDIRAQSDPLTQRAQDLQRAESRLRTEAERWKQERKASVDQLERDRLLLAQAWERLERERVQQAMRPPAEPQPQPIPARQAGILPMPSADASRTDPGLEEEMLRQFQSVRRDVRRNLDEPRSA
ncbi:MAG TPA: hypothetical protein VGZ22_14515 [Isosphaeraceae bacterium]|nr:hypothetical protein [Isosphaeraceae bacterium]